MRAKAETGKILQLALADGALPVAGYTLDPELLQRNLVVGFDPGSEAMHPFFVLRSQLWKHAKASQDRIFAVTSVQPGDGKTHVAVNLAAALSRVHPTILIELDFHRPSVGERLGLPAEHPGIDDYLLGTATLAESGIRPTGFNLTVHRVRCAQSAPGTLLASHRMTEMVKTIRSMEGAPLCIVDMPPTLVHDDLMMIMPVTDGALMVVQEGRTSRRALADAVVSISPSPIIGTILNMSITTPPPVEGYEYYYKNNEK